jgi:hypothetical protein
MNYLLITCYLAALVLFAFTRPQWRFIGPSLLDSFIIGLALFAAGSIVIWIEGLKDSEAVMQIGVSAALSGTFGAALWGYLFRFRVSNLDFFGDVKRLRADAYDDFTISVGLVVSSLVSIIFLVAVFSHDHVRSLLLDAFLHGAGTLNEVRVIVSSGTEGYFAPGYVKQFRDIIVPILCVAAILCGGTYRRRGVAYAALLIALAAMFISGQRLVVVQGILCLGSAFLIRRAQSNSHARSFSGVILVLLVLVGAIGAIGAMTMMLGRVPMGEQEKQQWLDKVVENETRTLDRVVDQARAYDDTIKALESSGEQDGRQEMQRLRDAALAEIEKQQLILKKLDQGESQSKSFSALISSGLSAPVALAMSVGDRAIASVPRENAISYSLWASRSPAMGAGWVMDLSGIRPGTQTQLSNELAMANRSYLTIAADNKNLGNSPLGLAADLYYNWGWPGVVLISALYALAFFLLDLALTVEKSPLTFAAKIFLFFSVPLMYSPFIFVLLGGAVAVFIAGYVVALRKMRTVFTWYGPRERGHS